MSPRFACLADWLHWQEQLHPAAIDLGLARIRPVADCLLGSALTSHKPFTITVAGTNGKGSCVTALGVMLAATGRCVGTFTSPHLLRYNERIRINGAEVDDQTLCAAFAAIDAARSDISLTYFEFNALAALWCFQQHAVDVQVLEVGLGGRLDAVNLVDADVAVITNIALDHTDWLGNTREQIAVEKGGILRAGGKLVYGEADMPHSLQQQVAALGVHCKQYGDAFGITINSNTAQWHWQNTVDENCCAVTAVPTLPLPSVACAVQALVWSDIDVTAVLPKVLPSLQLPGRFQQQKWRGKNIIFDVAHNVAGAQFLRERLQQAGMAPVHILFAVMADKDIDGMIAALAPAVSHWTLLTLEDVPRAATPEHITAHLLAQGVPAAAIQVGASVEQALSQAIAISGDRPLLIAGSFFTVAAVQTVLQSANPSGEP